MIYPASTLQADMDAPAAMHLVVVKGAARVTADVSDVGTGVTPADGEYAAAGPRPPTGPQLPVTSPYRMPR